MGWDYFYKAGDNPKIPVHISDQYDPPRHKGFDITTGISGEITDYVVRNVCEGIVVSRKKIGNGVALNVIDTIAVRTNSYDPNGNQLTVRYLHLKDFNDCASTLYTTILKGAFIGYTYNTGCEDQEGGGYHLHFDVNNALTTNGPDMSASNTIDPVRFFPNIIFN